YFGGRRGDRRGQEPCVSLLAELIGQIPHVLRARRHKVDTERAVDVKVHKAGDEISPRVSSRRAQPMIRQFVRSPTLGSVGGVNLADHLREYPPACLTISPSSSSIVISLISSAASIPVRCEIASTGMASLLKISRICRC